MKSMSTIINNVNEGLVALPPKLHNQIRQKIFIHILWRIRDESSKQNAETVAQEFNIKLPIELCPPLNNSSLDEFKLPYDVNDLPRHYPTNRTGRYIITIRLEWGCALDNYPGAIASYDVEKQALRFFLPKVNQINSVQQLEKLLQEITKNLKHELRHSVQVDVLGNHPEQIKMKLGYGSKSSPAFRRGMIYLPF